MTEKRIFWLDDDPLHRKQRAINKMEYMGWKVASFDKFHLSDDPESAAYTLKKEKYDAILLDLSIQCEYMSEVGSELWTGCTIFYWLLQQKNMPSATPEESKEFLSRLTRYGSVEIEVPNKEGRIPIFFITAYEAPEIKSAIKKLGRPKTFFIDKPIDREYLVEQLERQMSERKK